MHPVRRSLLLFGGCIVLGIGVALLLIADLGSDGFSTLVNGLSIFTGWAFFLANVIVSVTFLALAALRRVIPGVGTVAQILVVGGTASIVLEGFETPGSLAMRVGLLVVALPIIAVGVAAYLGANLGAGPMEAAGLAYDPPIPFKWSYNLVQFVSAITGWLLGGTIGFATIVVILTLGPLVDATSRLLGLDVHQESSLVQHE